jgi:hypothetical protein
MLSDIDQLDKEIDAIGGIDNIFWHSCQSKAWFYQIIDEKFKDKDIYQRGLCCVFIDCINSPKKLHNASRFIIEKPHYLIPALVYAYKLFSSLSSIIKPAVSKAICDLIELLVIFSPYYHTDLCVCKLCSQSKSVSYGQLIDGKYMKTIVSPLNIPIITEINKMLSIDNYIDAIVFANELSKNSHI